MHILITAASSVEAYRLKNRLGTGDIILGDYRELPAFMLNSPGMISLPDPASIAYTHEMLTLCLDKGIEKIYVLRAEELMNLVKAEQLFNEYGVFIVDGR